MTERLGPIHVRTLAGVDLVGWDELYTLVMGATAVLGSLLGVWIAGALGLLR